MVDSMQLAEEAAWDEARNRCAEEYGEREGKLLRCLEDDYGIKATWDGLRNVWLTESKFSDYPTTREMDSAIANMARSQPDKPVIVIAMERISELEALVREYSADYRDMCDVLFKLRGEQVSVNELRTAQMKTHEMGLRLRANELLGQL